VHEAEFGSGIPSTAGQGITAACCIIAARRFPIQHFVAAGKLLSRLRIFAGFFIRPNDAGNGQ
jgi:hypothetical protein